MGLAASQARLLSITSRMSDTELRSQLINNAKMRLTTDSAKVSDEYIAALNQTQMMFTNFDRAGNERYQNLTFNALTAYSSYNNQYGLVNNNGQLLVSDLDANNFVASGQNVNNFLQLYGLEQTTTYWDTLAANPLFGDMGVGYYDDFGEWQRFDVTVEDLKAMYEGEIDSHGIDHYGLEASYNSVEFETYSNLVATYKSRQAEYKESLHEAYMGFWNTIINRPGMYPDGFFDYTQQLLDQFSGLFVGHYSDNSYNYFNDMHIGPSGSDYGEKAYVNMFLGDWRAFASMLTDVPSSDNYTPIAFGPSTTYTGVQILGENCQDYIARINSCLNTLDIWYNGTYNSDHNSSYKDEYVYFENPNPGESQNLYLVDPMNPNYFIEDWIMSDIGVFSTNYIYEDGNIANSDFINGYNNGSGDISTSHTSGDKVLYKDVTNGDWLVEPLYYRPVHPGETPNVTYDGVGCVFTWPSKDDQYFDEAIPATNPAAASQNTSGTLVLHRRFVKDMEALSALEELYSILKYDTEAYVDPNFLMGINPEAETAFQEYQDAATQLAKFIWGGIDGANGAAVAADMFGNSINEKYYENLDDPTWVLSPNPDSDSIHFNPYYTQYPTSIGEWFDVTQDGANDYVNYQVIRDITLLECMLAQYGEPKYTWIDVNNPEENADAKVRWYTNLFNRMMQGYETIPPGLENSSDWIQFAFESGLVHMEQVNSYDQWVSLMYSNCTGITESTVDVDITLAEAKYKREMAKIEAKDKRYDMELKTLDTEHETLKQEYEQIKKVIQKNIDRNMKMFQMG